MALQKITIRPGIVKEATNYASGGGWFDGDKVRFRAGLPESIGGWKRVLNEKFKGSCRSIHDWVSLDKNRYLGLGTHLKFYILWGARYYDITPLRAQQPVAAVAANPFETRGDGKTTLLVHHPDNGSTLNDFVKFDDALGFPPPDDMYTGEDVPAGGADVLNREYQIIEILNKDTYVIDTGVPAVSEGVRGGGANVKAVYQIASGIDVAVPGTGWGVPPWGGGEKESEIPPHLNPDGSAAIGWGATYVSKLQDFVPYQQIRLWSQDNFGEDLFFCVRNGPIYYWNRTLGVTSRGVELKDIDDVDNPAGTVKAPPQLASVILMSENDRHLVAIGTNEIYPAGAIELDPLLVRWSSQENPYDWEPRRNNTAGSYRLSSGSAIIGALRTRQETLIWSDRNLHSMRFIGLPYVFSFNLVAEAVSMISPNAAVNASGRVWWMDRAGFFVYTGQLAELPCSVRDYVFSDFNFSQGFKVYAGHNYNFQEVIWFYPSAGSDEVDRYVLYQYVDGIWSIGQLERTSWVDPGWSSYPVATSDGYLYFHEYGDDADDEPLRPWIQSSDIDLDGGEKFVFIRKMIPDVHFRGKGAKPAVGVTLKTRRAPGDFYKNEDMAQVTPATRTCWVRARGRQLSLRIQSESNGTGWRWGHPRLDMQPDGKR